MSEEEKKKPKPEAKAEKPAAEKPAADKKPIAEKKEEAKPSPKGDVEDLPTEVDKEQFDDLLNDIEEMDADQAAVLAAAEADELAAELDAAEKEIDESDEMKELEAELEAVEKEIDDEAAELAEVVEKEENKRVSAKDMFEEEEDTSSVSEIPAPKIKKELPQEAAPVVPIHSGISPSAEGEQAPVELVLKGNSGMMLTYKVGGHQVSVYCENGHFVIKMAGGIEFKVPLEEAASRVNRRAS